MDWVSSTHENDDQFITESYLKARGPRNRLYNCSGHTMKAYGGLEVKLHSFPTSVLDGGE